MGPNCCHRKRSLIDLQHAPESPLEQHICFHFTFAQVLREATVQGFCIFGASVYTRNSRKSLRKSENSGFTSSRFVCSCSAFRDAGLKPFSPVAKQVWAEGFRAPMFTAGLQDFAAPSRSAPLGLRCRDSTLRFKTLRMAAIVLSLAFPGLASKLLQALSLQTSRFLFSASSYGTCRKF